MWATNDHEASSLVSYVLSAAALGCERGEDESAVLGA